MITIEEWRHAIHFARHHSRDPHSLWHGIDHWKAVASQGILLAEVCELGPNGRAAGALFGLFHDSRRLNDDHDPEHGLRAARDFAHWADQTNINTELHDALVQSMILHDDGQVTQDPLIGLGWDADRSTLLRVGITPHFRYFSCIPEALFPAYVKAGRAASLSPPDWDEIFRRAFV